MVSHGTALVCGTVLAAAAAAPRGAEGLTREGDGETGGERKTEVRQAREYTQQVV